jgi:NitT/TauT family transport system substrate-binding protein
MTSNLPVVPTRRTLTHLVKTATSTAIALAGLVALVPMFGIDGGAISNLGAGGVIAFLAAVIALSVGWILVENFRVRTVRIAQFDHTLVYLPLYVAEVMGFFAKERIKVLFENAHGDAETWDLVRTRRADVGVSDPIVMLDEQLGQDSGDVPLKSEGVVFASLLVRSPTRGVTLTRMSPVLKPTDLNGFTLYVFSKRTTSYTLLQYFLADLPKQLEPATPKDIQVLRPHTELNHLNPSTNVVVFTHEPAATTMVLARGAHEVFSNAKTFEPFLNTGVYCTKEYLRTHPDLVDGITRALERALCFINEHKAGAIDVAIRQFAGPTEEDVVLDATTRLIVEGIFPKHATVDEHLWSRAVHYRFRERAKDLAFSDHVDSGPGNRALRAIARLKRTIP